MNKEEREVPVPASLIAALKKYKTSQKRKRGAELSITHKLSSHDETQLDIG